MAMFNSYVKLPEGIFLLGFFRENSGKSSVKTLNYDWWDSLKRAGFFVYIWKNDVILWTQLVGQLTHISSHKYWKIHHVEWNYHSWVVDGGWATPSEKSTSQLGSSQLEGTIPKVFQTTKQIIVGGFKVTQKMEDFMGI